METFELHCELRCPNCGTRQDVTEKGIMVLDGTATCPHCGEKSKKPDILAPFRILLDEYQKEAKQWRSMALYLAECEATTALSVVKRKSSPKYEKALHSDICKGIVYMVTRNSCPEDEINPRYTTKNGLKSIIEYCQEAVVQCDK